MRAEHGTVSRYHGKDGCRCDPCKAAQAEYMRAYKARKIEEAGEDHDRHGTSYGFNVLKCRCAECKDWSSWHHRLRLYGITKEQAHAMWEQSGRKCRICKTGLGEHQIVIDHNHDTGRVRGILCKECNFGLGKFRDSVDSLRAAIRYLEENEDAR